ncbi:MAG: hypothetical protein HC812_15820 [Leptolyngbya sp. RL_3_1]|nr:hypothetical protein [Leptolyngbya sp. RL_3_1]
MASARSSQSPRWRTLLLQPTWIAGVISVGVHGVLFAAGPTFSNLNLDTLADPDALATRRVPLVELTPEEQQQHLPDFSNSFYSLSTLDELDGLPSPLVPYPPQGDSSLSQGRGRSPLDRTIITTQPSPSYRSPTTVTQPQRVTPGGNRPGAQTEPVATPDAAADPKPATATESASTPTDLATRPGTSPSTEAAALGPAINENSGNVEGQPPAADQPAFAYNSDTPAEAWERWLADVAPALVEPALRDQPLPEETLPLAYVPRQAACPSADQYGLVAALVNADGKLVEGSVKLLKSTGNEALDTWATTEGVETFKFPAAIQEQTAFLLEVYVERAESCD